MKYIECLFTQQRYVAVTAIYIASKRVEKISIEPCITSGKL